MQIAVLSQTHVASLADLPEELIERLRSVHLIIHTGGYTSYRLVEELREINLFRGVSSESDDDLIRQELPEWHVVRVGQRRIGVIHGDGEQAGLAKRVRKEFLARVDAIVYGHAHTARLESLDDVLMFNPGTVNLCLPGVKPSFGLLTVTDEEIVGEIVPLPSVSSKLIRWPRFKLHGFSRRGGDDIITKTG